MLESILQSLRDVSGMQGALIVDHSGAVVAHHAHGIYDLAALQQVARWIVSATDSVQLINDDWEVVTTHFGEGKLVLRSLRTSGAKPRRYILAAIADQTLNLAFLGVALRVAASKLIAELQETSAPAASSAAPVVPVPSGSTGRMPVVESRPEPAPSRLGASGNSLASAVDGADVVIHDAASLAFLAACTRALAASIGPMAQVYVRDALRRLCGGRAFSRADGPALISQLSAMLDSSEDRATFQRATRAL